MESRFLYSDDNKRYHTYSYHLKRKYGGKTAKIPLNAGLACPHAESGGCIYCGSEFKIGAGQIGSFDELNRQFREGVAKVAGKWGNPRLIAYFQSGTNTNANIEILKRIYESVFDFTWENGEKYDIAGVSIATRPDCVDVETADYLARLNRHTDVTVELGLQTASDLTAIKINRGCRTSDFIKSYELLSGRGIPITAHIINSLPGENAVDMMDTVKFLAGLTPILYGIKIHMLSISEGTRLAEMYRAGEISLLSEDEYIGVLVNQLEILPAETVIMRISDDPCAEKLIAPMWALKKLALADKLDAEMQRRGTYQGRLSGKNYMKEHYMDSNEKPRGKSLTNILSEAKRFFDVGLKENGIYADFTAGNGNDTLYIRRACPSAKIYSFDIQQRAIDSTRKRIESENLNYGIEFICDSHANFKKYIFTPLDGAIFNLGFLPGGDRGLTTKVESTISCLSDALNVLNVRGVIVVVVYPGHPEGAREGELIYNLSQNLDRSRFDAVCHRLINIHDAPYIFAFQRKS